MKKIIIASDSFKGSFSSLEVANTLEKAVLQVFPGCEIVKIPIADGGEGTVEALISAKGGKKILCTVNNPLMQSVKASYGIVNDGKTAIIEMASASGLTLIPEDQHNPMEASSFGTGELIKDALERGCSDFLIGLGGSATNDAGTGMLQALGFKFINKDGKALNQGGKILQQIHDIDETEVIPELKKAIFTIACDVRNPFSGKNGAAYVFAPQKGADEKMIEKLDQGLKNFEKVIQQKKGGHIDKIPGVGAAGGLGGGFLAFLPATLKPGVQMILEVIKFEQLINGADLIITGEGKLDDQTAMGKVADGVLQIAKKQKIPVIAMTGHLEKAKSWNKNGFLAAFPILPYPVSLEQAMDANFTRENLQRTLIQVLRIIREFRVQD